MCRLSTNSIKVHVFVIFLGLLLFRLRRGFCVHLSIILLSSLVFLGFLFLGLFFLLLWLWLWLRCWCVQNWLSKTNEFILLSLDFCACHRGVVMLRSVADQDSGVGGPRVQLFALFHNGLHLRLLDVGVLLVRGSSQLTVLANVDFQALHELLTVLVLVLTCHQRRTTRLELIKLFLNRALLGIVTLIVNPVFHSLEILEKLTAV
mmetsp:Transcript_12643/g.25786  ORF Transcript_12643/g.25786 Transcript_12643/m.25786 type:complete len:205 (+) Transcript_12643:260-874(+)